MFETVTLIEFPAAVILFMCVAKLILTATVSSDFTRLFFPFLFFLNEQSILKRLRSKKITIWFLVD